MPDRTVPQHQQFVRALCLAELGDDRAMPAIERLLQQLQCQGLLDGEMHGTTVQLVVGFSFRATSRIFTMIWRNSVKVVGQFPNTATLGPLSLLATSLS